MSKRSRKNQPREVHQKQRPLPPIASTWRACWIVHWLIHSRRATRSRHSCLIHHRRNLGGRALTEIGFECLGPAIFLQTRSFGASRFSGRQRGASREVASVGSLSGDAPSTRISTRRFRSCAAELDAKSSGRRSPRLAMSIFLIRSPPATSARRTASARRIPRVSLYRQLPS